jgi:hypothetical protein
MVRFTTDLCHYSFMRRFTQCARGLAASHFWPSVCGKHHLCRPAHRGRLGRS